MTFYVIVKQTNQKYKGIFTNVVDFKQKWVLKQGNRQKLPNFKPINLHMLSSLLLAGALSVSIHLSGQSDTLPKGHAPALGTEGERQAHDLQQLFRDHYTPQTYPLFEGPITRMALGSYRFGSFIMRMDSLPDGMRGLLSRGLLYPGLLGPVFGSIDTLSIDNIVELKGLSPFPQIRRFSCWVFNRRMANPTWYVFELTNKHGTTDMDMASFIGDARLTFLYQVSIII